MTNPKFDEKELKIVGEVPGFFPGVPATPLYDYPVTRKEAVYCSNEARADLDAYNC